MSDATVENSNTDCQSYREGVKEDHTANYFSHSNQTATQMRDKIAEESLEMLIDWLKTKGGNVGIHGSDVRVLSMGYLRLTTISSRCNEQHESQEVCTSLWLIHTVDQSLQSQDLCSSCQRTWLALALPRIFVR